jgi:hypothetical protein
MQRLLLGITLEASGCWTLATKPFSTGYARAIVARKSVRGHRLLYEYFREPIPAGLVLDHKCRNRACVNPDHMEPVTQSENVRRGALPGLLSAGAIPRKRPTGPKVSVCHNGHPYTAANSYFGGKAGRVCRECMLANQRRYKARKKAAALVAGQ